MEVHGHPQTTGREREEAWSTYGDGTGWWIDFWLYLYLNCDLCVDLILESMRNKIRIENREQRAKLIIIIIILIISIVG